MYVCGVSDWRRGGGYERNFHAPIVPAPGETVTLPMFGAGQQFVASDAKLLEIPPLPDNWQGLPTSFTRCRNYRFGLATFGLPAQRVLDLRPRLVRKQEGMV